MAIIESEMIYSFIHARFLNLGYWTNIKLSILEKKNQKKLGTYFLENNSLEI